ncbi:hypothetical protein V2J09_016066 [Rumex salicifolius]
MITRSPAPNSTTLLLVLLLLGSSPSRIDDEPCFVYTLTFPFTSYRITEKRALVFVGSEEMGQKAIK